MHSSDKSKQAAEPKASKTQDNNFDAPTAVEMLQQVTSLIGPMLEFHKADELMTMDDVKFYWNVKAVRDRDTPFAHIEGSCTMHQLLADNSILNAPYKVEQEMTNKIIIPVVSLFQADLQRLVLESAIAKDKATDFDDLMDEEPC